MFSYGYLYVQSTSNHGVSIHITNAIYTLDLRSIRYSSNSHNALHIISLLFQRLRGIIDVLLNNLTPSLPKR